MSATTLSAKLQLIDEISSKLQSIGTNANSLKDKLNDIGTTSTSFNSVATSVDDSSSSFTSATMSAREYDSQLDLCTAAINTKADEELAATDSTDAYTDSVNTATEADEKLEEQLGRTGKQYDETGEETEKASKKTDDYKNKTKDAFTTIEGLIATAGVVAYFKSVYSAMTECINVASEYESAVAKVTTIADTNVLSTSEIKSELTELSEKTGVAVKSLAEAEYQALSAGQSTADAAQFVEQANKLAVGGFTETATAVDVLTTMLNAYGKDTSETAHLADVLIQTQNLGKTTVDELASSMGRVIPTASAYNVTVENLGAAYATMTASGIATAESTTYLNSMLNELADSGSDVSGILQEKTGKSFSELNAEGMSLGDVVNVLGNAVDNDATAFANLWSSAEGGKAALSMLNAGTEKYNTTLNQIVTASGAAETAYETMTSTAKHSSQALDTAATNAKVAIGDALLPAQIKFNQAITSFLNGVTDVATKHPEVVRAVAAVSTALGVLTAGITAYVVVTKVAKIATAAFTAVMEANPIVLAATAIATLVAGIATYITMEDAATEEAVRYTTATETQASKIDELKSSLQELNDAGEGHSAKAEELRYQIEELETTYDTTKQTVEEFAEAHKQAVSTYDNNMSTHQTNIEKLESEETATRKLVDRLSELGSQSKISADDQAEMQNIIDILNAKMPTLGLTYSQVSNDIKGSVDQINAAIQEEISIDKYNGYVEALKTAQESQEGLKNNLAASKKEFNAADDQMNQYKETINTAQQAWDNMSWFDPNKYLLWGDDDLVSSAKDNIESYQDTYDSLKETYENDKAKVEENEKAIEEYTQKIRELNALDLGLNLKTDDEAQQAVNEAAISIRTSLDELSEAYDNAYQSAYDSIHGQYSLWDEAVDVSDEKIALSTDAISKNLDTQIAYWNNYSSNLENLKSRNIKGLDDMLKSIDDGSEESAKALAGLAGASDTQLEQIVGKYNKLQEGQKKTSTSVAQLETDFNKSLNNVATDAEEAIDKLNLSTEASESAKATMDAYIQAIRDGSSGVQTEIETVIAKAKSALQINNSDNKKSNNTSKKKKSDNKTKITDEYDARGTTYAADAFIAGEEGPELVVGYGGATVFTASQTQNILNNGSNIETIPLSDDNNYIRTNYDTVNSEKVITIKLEGGTPIQMSGNSGLTKEQCVQILSEQIKPVLISVLEQEVYEEGDESYEY